jgi:hypothetical protein
MRSGDGGAGGFLNDKARAGTVSLPSQTEGLSMPAIAADVKAAGGF